MSISNEIRKLQLRGSPEQQRRAAAEARQKKDRLARKVSGPQTAIRVDPSFARQLEKKAVQARERLGKPQRGDLPEVIDKLRLEGKLPPAPDDVTRVGYEPTPEEILGEETVAGLNELPEPAEGDDVPDADAVLNAAPKGSIVDFTEEELDEIARLNPPSKKPAKALTKQQLPRGKRR